MAKQYYRVNKKELKRLKFTINYWKKFSSGVRAAGFRVRGVPVSGAGGVSDLRKSSRPLFFDSAAQVLRFIFYFGYPQNRPNMANVRNIRVLPAIAGGG